MIWYKVEEDLPPYGEEVLVWVDGHRGASWSNNYAVVAYRSNTNGKFYEERHGNEVIGVVKWARFSIPN